MASYIMGLPLVQGLMPILFVIGAVVVSTPQLLLYIALHPLEFIATSDSVPERLTKLRHRFFYYFWKFFSPIADPGDKTHKEPLLAKCYGTVLEVGAGVGDNIKYYDRSKVERLVVVEPNVHMHPKIRDNAEASGYHEKDGSLLLLSCGGAIDDEKALAAAGIGPGSLDSIAVIHVLCGIPKPAQAIEMYRRLLKDGGLLVFYEHVRSSEQYTVQWQNLYQNIWPIVFDGCCVDRPTGAWIIGGPDAAIGSSLVTGKELLHSAASKQRWSNIHFEIPEDQQRYAAVPHIKGWATKGKKI